MVAVLPQSRPSGASLSDRIPIADHCGRGVPLAALATLSDHAIRAQYPVIDIAHEKLAKLGVSRCTLRITWAGFENMGFKEDIRLLGHVIPPVKAIANAFDRFIRESVRFAGHPPAPNLWPQHYTLQDLILTGLIVYGGGIIQAEVMLAK
ncbi:hypothetical protein BD311DRAFT_811880 [Dichomitus squalens]|uniref:Uncharacterized protein n=1 Tax=Dichomitus squalens TaxID=114155 RepID=A0A4V2JYP6_9APHY|nr:hypothetical protein BD311DRAFT_811880 [Dichomitus squalens]